MNFQVIGIHKGGASGAKNYNLGTFLKEPIKLFNEEMEKNNMNNKEKKSQNEDIKNIDIKEEVKIRKIMIQLN